MLTILILYNYILTGASMVPNTEDSFVRKLTRKFEKYKSKIAHAKGIENYCILHFNEVCNKINKVPYQTSSNIEFITLLFNDEPIG